MTRLFPGSPQTICRFTDLDDADDSEARTDDVVESLGEGEAWKALIPASVRARFDVHNFHRAAEVLSMGYHAELNELCEALDKFSIPRKWITDKGGNESDIPKRFSELLRPSGWNETRIRADLQVRRTVAGVLPVTHFNGPLKGQQKLDKDGKLRWKFDRQEIQSSPIKDYIDGHKIDYVKNKVAFDLEWNSKDQTFDRDLFAFRTFFDCQEIEVGVLVTRSVDLNRAIAVLGVSKKYGASTTWMGKLLYRLKSGRSGGCPVLAFGIKSNCVDGWDDEHSQFID